MTIAVIGGAGYIGSHVVKALEDRGDKVVIVDDMSTGLPARVSGRAILVTDISAQDAENRMAEFFLENGVNAVMHFAARKAVGESVEKPLWYYKQNVEGTRRVLQACEAAGVTDFVFSSSAAVYGSPESGFVDEDGPTRPINPYGETKLASEWLVNSVARATGMRATSLRYFNVVGTENATLADTAKHNLVPIIMEVMSRDAEVPVFGTDYDTPDGTCLRDYVHVLDLADAHLVSLDDLRNAEPGTVKTFNVGTGVATSVLEILSLVEKASGREVKRRLDARRPGDPAVLGAKVEKIERELCWRASRTAEDAIRSLW